MDRSDKDRTIEFLREHWPPTDALALYNLGWREFRELGKVPSIRAVLAVYECRKRGQDRTDYERAAIRAVAEWVLLPTDDKRRTLGQLAGMQEPGYSFARNLANMASRTDAWQSAVAYNLTGNPRLLSTDDFTEFCAAIHNELSRWSLDEGDPVAERLAREDEAKP